MCRELIWVRVKDGVIGRAVPGFNLSIGIL